MVDKYLGIVLVSVILFYLVKNATGASAVIKSLSGFNVSAITALQGQGSGYATI